MSKRPRRDRVARPGNPPRLGGCDDFRNKEKNGRQLGRVDHPQLGVTAVGANRNQGANAVAHWLEAQHDLELATWMVREPS